MLRNGLYLSIVGGKSSLCILKREGLALCQEISGIGRGGGDDARGIARAVDGDAEKEVAGFTRFLNRNVLLLQKVECLRLLDV